MTAAAALPHVPDAASQLARWGFRVHPLRGKQPILRDWPQQATDSPDAARDLFARYPHSNVGVATGRGLLVLDVDDRKGGAAALDALVAAHGPIPDTVTVETGGGGRHYYLRAPSGLRLRNSAGKLGTGLDIRTDGGQVVAPPSVHPDTRAAYAWAPDRSPADVEIAPAPQWLLDLLVPRPAHGDAPPAAPLVLPSLGDVVSRARRYVATMPPAIAGAGGHDATFAVAQVLVRGFGLDAATSLSILSSDYNPRCQPPWSDRELSHKVASAERDSALPVGYLRDIPAARDERPRKPAAVHQIREHVDADTVAAPLNSGYASLCRVLRTARLRALVMGDGDLEYDEQSLFPTIARAPIHPHHIGRIREACENKLRDDKNRPIRFTKEAVQDAILQVARERPYHPVADWLHALGWDGVPRLDFVAEDILGIDTTRQPLATAMLRNWFVSAVARALDPGCKVDTVLILKGKQSARKSTFFQTLAGPQWFANNAVDIHSKDAVLVMAGVWILEWAELDSMLRARDAESVKQFVTCAADRIRAPYEAAPRVFPRCSVIVGTTNSDDFLRDASGSRRYWPIDVADHVIDIDLASDWREQLWAEAVVHYRAGARWWLDGTDETALAGQNSRFEAADVWTDLVADYVSRQTVDEVTVADVLSGGVHKPAETWTRGDANRVADILKHLGWSQSERRTLDRDGRRRRVWTRPARSDG